MEKTLIDNGMHVDMNWEPYKIPQSHFGPPLSYVGDKLENAIIDTHRLFHIIGVDVNEPNASDTIQPNDLLKSQLRGIFRNSLKSFLALYDNLEFARDGEAWVDVALNFSDKEIRDWLTETWQNCAYKF